MGQSIIARHRAFRAELGPLRPTELDELRSELERLNDQIEKQQRDLRR